MWRHLDSFVLKLHIFDEMFTAQRITVPEVVRSNISTVHVNLLMNPTIFRISNLTNAFLRRDEGNTAIEAIDMKNKITKQIVTHPLSNEDVPTNNYVDKNAISTDDGDVYKIKGRY